MCGRYSLTHTAEEIARRFDVEAPVWFRPRYNAAPTETMPVVRATGDDRQREIAELRWGLVPFWADDLKIGARMINARSETVGEKPAFRTAFSRRRCLIPNDGFYEWVERDGKKWPIRIAVGDDGLGAFAGIWERWESAEGRVVETFSILTAEADESIAELHDRMPVWAPDEHWEAWLFADSGADEIVASMVEHFPAESIRYGPVSRRLNKAGTEGAELMEAPDGPRLPTK